MHLGPPSVKPSPINAPALIAGAVVVVAMSGLGFLAGRTEGAASVGKPAREAAPLASAPTAAAGRAPAAEPTAGKNLQVSPVKIPNTNRTGKPESAAISPKPIDAEAAASALADLRAAIGASDFDRMAYAEAR